MDLLNRIYDWKELQQILLQDIKSDSDLHWFILRSKGVPSSDLKDLIRAWIGKEEGMEPHDLELARTTHGKPYFEGTSWKFNLSHSGDYTLGALHPGREVGVDLEEWKPKSRLEPIVERYFFSEEKERLSKFSTIEAWEEEALQMFTIKEALTKLSGGTLFEGLARINTTKSSSELWVRRAIAGAFCFSIGLGN